jgi:hypothetical protein
MSRPVSDRAGSQAGSRCGFGCGLAGGLVGGLVGGAAGLLEVLDPFEQVREALEKVRVPLLLPLEHLNDLLHRGVLGFAVGALGLLRVAFGL